VGRLTTHVLDIAVGRPAAGLEIEMWEIGEEPRMLSRTRTNADGRAPAPLLDGEAMRKGVYELRFHAGAYLKERIGRSDPPFLDIVPVRFGIADPTAHYHVPLLLSPYGYSTYRGS
jgi:5-hydroxyisourate hydrolase